MSPVSYRGHEVEITFGSILHPRLDIESADRERIVLTPEPVSVEVQIRVGFPQPDVTVRARQSAVLTPVSGLHVCGGLGPGVLFTNSEFDVRQWPVEVQVDGKLLTVQVRPLK